MTDKLYATDAYLERCDARVTEVSPHGIVLDRTVAYARGGGQPGDIGTITTAGGAVALTDTFIDETGALIHQLADGRPKPAVGESLEVAIDTARRRRIMRTHTALHALSGIVYTHFDAKVTGGNMGDDGTARMDFELDHIIQDFGEEVEKLAERGARRRP
jgi:misacylated tRNA(Ala) deacylase